MNKDQSFSKWASDQVSIRRAKIDQREKIVDALQKKSLDVEKGLFDKGRLLYNISWLKKPN